MNLKKTSIISLGFSIFLASIIFNPKFLAKFDKQKPINLASLEDKYQKSPKTPIFNNQKLSLIPPEIVKQELQVLGEENTPKDEKVIYIDLAKQRLYAFEGNRLVYNFLVSTGKWGRTPTGIFHIWTKLKYTLMSGGSQALGTYYYLPNVPYTMFFYNDEVPKHVGYGIHGTYWHDNFGHPMSHGCINMKTEEVEQLYYWAEPNLNGRASIAASSENPGTKIVIFGIAPEE